MGAPISYPFCARSSTTSGLLHDERIPGVAPGMGRRLFEAIGRRRGRMRRAGEQQNQAREKEKRAHRGPTRRLWDQSCCPPTCRCRRLQVLRDGRLRRKQAGYAGTLRGRASCSSVPGKEPSVRVDRMEKPRSSLIAGDESSPPPCKPVGRVGNRFLATATCSSRWAGIEIRRCRAPFLRSPPHVRHPSIRDSRTSFAR